MRMNIQISNVPKRECVLTLLYSFVGACSQESARLIALIFISIYLQLYLIPVYPSSAASRLPLAISSKLRTERFSLNSMCVHVYSCVVGSPLREDSPAGSPYVLSASSPEQSLSSLSSPSSRHLIHRESPDLREPEDDHHTVNAPECTCSGVLGRKVATSRLNVAIRNN